MVFKVMSYHMALHLTVSIDLEHWEASTHEKPATQTKKKSFKKRQGRKCIVITVCFSVSHCIHMYNTKVDFSIVIIQVESLSNGFCQQLFLYLRIAMAMKILYRNKKKRWLARLRKRIEESLIQFFRIFLNFTQNKFAWPCRYIFSRQ